MISLVAVVLSMANVVSSKKVRNSANNHVKPSHPKLVLCLYSSDKQKMIPKELFASKAKHAGGERGLES